MWNETRSMMEIDGILCIWTQIGVLDRRKYGEMCR